MFVSRLAVSRRSNAVVMLVRYLYSKATLSVAWLFWWAPSMMRMGVLVIIEALYNFYSYCTRTSGDEEDILRKIIQEGSVTNGVAIVTGGTSGIGKEIVLSLLQAGYRCLKAARNMDKAQKLVQEHNDSLIAMRCDISSISEIRLFVNEFLKKEDNLDILINCAGNYTPKFIRTKDGLESHMAVHVMGTYLMTTLLTDVLARSKVARVVTVASSAHVIVRGPFKLKTFTDPKEFSRMQGYANAKYAQILLMKQLSLELRGKGISVNVMHPGMVDTDIAREDILTRSVLHGVVRIFLPFLILKPRQGALTAIWLALSNELVDVTGRYFVDLAEDNISYSLEKDFINGRALQILEYCQNYDSKIQ